MPQLRRVVLRLTSGCALAAAAPGPSQVAMIHPIAVTNCNIDMESLIADPNRSIATLVRARGGLCLAGAQAAGGAALWAVQAGKLHCD